MHAFAVCNGKFFGVYSAVKVAYERLFYFTHAVEAHKPSVVAVNGVCKFGHVNAVQRAYFFVKLLGRAAVFFINFRNVCVHAFPVAYEEYVNKIGERLGVYRARSARNYKRIASAAALFARKRNACKVEHVQHVGIAQLVLQ